MRAITLLFFLAFWGLGQAVAQELVFIGIRVSDVSKEDAQKLGWASPLGAKVVKSVPGGPAATAGLQPGDIILSMDGNEIANSKQFLAQLQTESSGVELRLNVLRSGNEQTVVVRPSNSAEALVGLGRAIEQEPNSLDIYLSRSELLFRLNRTLEAGPDCDQILRLAPNEGWGYYCRARVSIASDKTDTALEDLNTAIVKMYRSERPLITRAMLYERKKDHDRAIADLTRALAISERDTNALTMRGEAYLAKALIERAIDDFTAALAIDKNNERAKRGLQSAQGKRDEVVAPEITPAPSPNSVSTPATPPTPSTSAPSLADTQKPAPKNGQERIDVEPKLKAEVAQLRAKKDFKKALELLDKAIAGAPEHAGLRNLRGAVLQSSGDFAKAILDYDQAATMLPQFSEAHTNRINARIALRKTDEAMKAAEEFLQLNPDLALAYDLRGKVHMQAERRDQAQADFDQAIAKNPKLTAAWVDRGQLFLSNKVYDKALEDFSHAIEIDPKLDAPYSSRGKAYLALKNTTAAVQDFKKALSLNAINWVALTNLQALQVTKALQQLGQIKKDAS